MSPVRVRAWCAAPVDGPHPATHRSGYCEHHHEEYTRAMTRWRARRYQATKGRGQDPGDRDTNVAGIEFTSNPTASVVLTFDEVAQLRLLLTDMSAKGAFLIDFTYDDTAYLNTPEPEFRKQLSKLQAAQIEVIRVIAQLTDAAPEHH